MNFDRISDLLSQQVEQHTEQAFVIKSLLLLFCILILRIFMGGLLFYGIATFAVLNYLAYLWVNTNKGIWGILKENVSIIGAPRVIGDDKITTRPWGTWALITINLFVFYFIQVPENEQFIRNNLMFFPYDPNYFNIFLSFISAAYLHADLLHISGNMAFLWAVGAVVERRLGTQRFLVIYHLSAFASHLLAAFVYGVVMDEPLHSIGASGAISGVMGVFLIRCYFKRMTFPLPTLGIIPVCLNLQVNGLVVMGLFFTLDLRGGLSQVTGANTSNTGHWAHLGGFIAGVLYAWQAKLGEQAIEERHRDIGSGVLDGKTIRTDAFDEAGGFNGARKSLQIALLKEPDNVESLLSLAQIESHFAPTDLGKEYYLKAIAALAKQSTQKLTPVFTEYFARYRELVEPELQFKIAGMLYKEGNLDLAERVLKMLADCEEVSTGIREQSLLLSGRILEKMELHEAAELNYRQFLALYPDSSRLSIIMERLSVISSSVKI